MAWNWRVCPRNPRVGRIEPFLLYRQSVPVVSGVLFPMCRLLVPGVSLIDCFVFLKCRKATQCRRLARIFESVLPEVVTK